MKSKEFDEESRKGSQQKLPSIPNVPKYDSPFAIPDDAEVSLSIPRSLEWRKRKNNENANKNKETKL